MSMTLWWCLITPLKDFDDYHIGQVYSVELTERWAHLIASDYVRLLQKWPLELSSSSE
jgi:hypothetical protein